MPYLNPIKMYVFVSAFFFLFFFSVFHPSVETNEKETQQPTYRQIKSKIEKEIEDIQSNLKDKDAPEFTREIYQNRLQLLQQDTQMLAKDTTHLSGLNHFKVKESTIPFGQYKDVAHYEFAQDALPRKGRDSWLKKKLIKKGIQFTTEIW